MAIVQQEIIERIKKLGFELQYCIDCGLFWSIVALSSHRRFNIQLSKDDLKVRSIHGLKYKFNAQGTKITAVDRIKIQ